MKNITFKIVSHDTRTYEKAIDLSEEILRKPIGLTFSQEEREEYKKLTQIAGCEDDDVIATAMLVEEDQQYKMQRVTVRHDLQKTGIGSKILQFCEDYAKQQKAQEIYCHARKTAVDFYKKNGYAPEGDYFEEFSLPHIKMKKNL